MLQVINVKTCLSFNKIYGDWFFKENITSYFSTLYFTSLPAKTWVCTSCVILYFPPYNILKGVLRVWNKKTKSAKYRAQKNKLFVKTFIFTFFIMPHWFQHSCYSFCNSRKIEIDAVNCNIFTNFSSVIIWLWWVIYCKIVHILYN